MNANGTFVLFWYTLVFIMRCRCKLKRTKRKHEIQQSYYKIRISKSATVCHFAANKCIIISFAAAAHKVKEIIYFSRNKKKQKTKETAN